jgi:hypothetical protein
MNLATYKELSKRHSFRSLSQSGSSPNITPLLGAFLQESLPGCIQANTGQPFLTCNLGGLDGRPFYTFNLPGQTHLQISPTEASFTRHRYRHPNKVAAIVRQGEVSAYLSYLSKQNSNLLPCAVFSHVFNDQELDAITSNMVTLLEQRRPITIITNSSYAAHLKAKHSISVRASIEIQGITLRTPDLLRIQNYVAEERIDLDKPTKYPKGLTRSVAPESLHVLVLGTGYNTQNYVLPPLTARTLPAWSQAFSDVRVNVMEPTFGPAHLIAHSKAFEVARDAATHSILPQLNRFPQVISSEALDIRPITLNRRLKVKSNGLTSAFLSYDEETLRVYNATEGRDTGVRSAALSKPNLLLNGFNTEFLNSLGYPSSISPEVQGILDKKNKHFKKQLVPLNPVTDAELLAYFEPGFYECRRTVTNPHTSEVIWEAGQHYHINPGWTTQTYDGGSEPILDEARTVVGLDHYKIKYSVLRLTIETAKGNIDICENECRDDEADAEEELTDQPKNWHPVLDEFVEAFPLPQVNTVWEAYPEEMAKNLALLAKRMPQLKGYQAELAAANAIKHGAILGSDMGAGKTYQSLALIFLKQKSFNLIIVPPSLLSQWIKTCKLNGFWARPLMSHKAISKLQRRYKRLKGRTPADKRKGMLADQEIYVSTPEFLGLGDMGNRVYTPWKATYCKTDGWITDGDEYDESYRLETQYEIQATRYAARAEAQTLHRSLNRAHKYGAHVKNCPSCGASHTEGFSVNGMCSQMITDRAGRKRICGYRAYGYAGHRQNVYTDAKGDTFSGLDFIRKDHLVPASVTTTNHPPAAQPVQYDEVELTRVGKTKADQVVHEHSRSPKVMHQVSQKSHSHNAYPAAKRLGKIFGLKLIDEVHDLANLSSQKGSSVLHIKAKETAVLSGTLSRGYVTDIESALIQIHGAYTPPFPFPTWERKAFRDQFVTTRVKKSVVTGGEGRTKTSVSAVPEASNVTRLRRMLNCNITAASEAVIEAEWKLPPLTRRYHAVTLNDKNGRYYQQVLSDVAEWYKYASSKEIQRNAMSKLWELRHICEGEEKLEAITQYIRLWVKTGQKFVLAAPTKALYLHIRDVLESFGVKFIAVDEHVAPDKREAVTSRFSQPDIHCLLSRPKLICLGLNTLVHANKLLIAGPEYQPSTIRQLEKRLARPGQLHSSVEVVYPLVRMAPKVSIEEEMLRLILKKEIAVNEVLKGKVRWAKPAMLIASALEKQGAARVLQALVEDEKEDTTEQSLGHIDLDALFTANEELDTAARNDTPQDKPKPQTPTTPRGTRLGHLTIGESPAADKVVVQADAECAAPEAIPPKAMGRRLTKLQI